MPFNQSTFGSLQRHAAATDDPYDRFDLLWKAFNHYYASLYRIEDGRDIKEWQLIHRAIDTLPPTTAFPIMRGPALGRLSRIAPVFDEQIWNRFGRHSTTRHAKVKAVLREIAQGRTPFLEHVKAVADLLYVIRCNLAHGFKTPDGARDVEVLRAASPVLEKLIADLPVPCVQRQQGIA